MDSKATEVSRCDHDSRRRGQPYAYLKRSWNRWILKLLDQRGLKQLVFDIEHVMRLRWLKIVQNWQNSDSSIFEESFSIQKKREIMIY